MPESEGCGGEPVGSGGVDGGVVRVRVPVLEEDEPVPVHHLLAEDHGEKLVVGDVLHEGGHDVSRLLEDGLVAPVRVQLLELATDAVVLAHHQRVHQGQHSLLVHPGVAGKEAEVTKKYDFMPKNYLNYLDRSISSQAITLAWQKVS